MEAPEGFTAVRRGGIIRFIPVTPQVVEKAVRPRRRVCCNCGKRVTKRATRCWDCIVAHRRAQAPPKPYETPTESIWDVLARTLAVDRVWEVCACGCWIRPAEFCPQCVIPWMRANTRTDDVIYYVPQKIEERRAA